MTSSAHGSGCSRAVRRALLVVAALALQALVSAPSTTARADVSGQGVNQRSEYWRAVREGREGYSAVPGPERGELIENGGQNWRRARNGWVAVYGPWLMGAMLAAIVAFYLYRGRIRIEQPPSGERVRRWSAAERALHWYTATLFVVLAVTGLSLLLGRAVLMPVLGKEAFAAFAAAAMRVHNIAGPFFALGIASIVAAWVRDNVPRRVDLEWFRKAGGMSRRVAHASAGRMNGGEKVWFWFIATAGLAVVASGFVLDFPNFGQERETMQLAHMVHAVLAIVWIAIAFGHIYIGTLGTEGALEGMVKGDVSAEWARQHHDLWYVQVTEKDERPDRATPAD